MQVAERWLQVELGDGGVRVDGEPVEVELSPSSVGPVRIVRIGDRSIRVVAHRDGRGRWTLEIGRRRQEVRVMDAAEAAIEAGGRSERERGGPQPLRAPMPGLVVGIGVSPGDVVERGVGLVTLDGMKMENELKAEGRARVADVLVSRGVAVERGQLLVTFEDPEIRQ